MNLGMSEMIFIFLLALIIFGPRKLPELGRSLGKGINEFKRASNELKSTFEEEVRIEEQRDKERQRAEAARAQPLPPEALTDPSAALYGSVAR